MLLLKSNGDIVRFWKEKDYIMVNNSLGKGSFGKTVILQDPFIDELFVAKKYEPDFDNVDDRKKYYKNFLDEIKIMYKLNHRNIVRIYNYYAYEESYIGYILMEHINGTTIVDWFENCSNGLTTATSNELFIQLIDAFEYLQKHGVVHRDIREGNILIDKDDIVKVIDFGIGKLITSDSTVKDSFYANINRENSDTLPKEYYEGTYTSLTDMFYLAELINRLLNTYDCPEFKYQFVLDKMMAKDPQERYSSFSEVKIAIEQYNFNSLSISEEEKKTYHDFADALDFVIDVYTETPDFNTDCSSIISKLESVLNNNIFEQFISNNADIINVFVSVSYTYDNSYGITVDAVSKFVRWIKRSSDYKRNLILSNLINKISNKPIDFFATDTPF